MKTKKRHPKYLGTIGRQSLQRSCPKCGQPPGLECRDPRGEVVGPHRPRTVPVVAKRRKTKVPPPSPVRVSFKCPGCGGPHARKDCPEGAPVEVVVEEEPFRIPTRKVAFTRVKRDPVDNAKKTGKAGPLDRASRRAEGHREANAGSPSKAPDRQ